MQTERNARQRLLRPLAYAALVLAAAAILSINAGIIPTGTSNRDIALATGRAAAQLRDAGLLDGWRAHATAQPDPPRVDVDSTPLDPNDPPPIPPADATADALRNLEPPIPVRINWRAPGRPTVTRTVTPSE